MTVSMRSSVLWWVSGLIAFAIVIYLHIPLAIEAVPGGISDHQAAPDAKTVDAIQNAWRREGVSNQAAIAMIGDLIFIGIYGVGCVLVGMYYRAQGHGLLRMLGWVALSSGIVFLATDYGETICQFIQLMQQAGDDDLAGLASTVRPIKIAACVISFFAVLTALIVEHFAKAGSR